MFFSDVFDNEISMIHNKCKCFDRFYGSSVSTAGMVRAAMLIIKATEGENVEMDGSGLIGLGGLW